MRQNLKLNVNNPAIHLVNSVVELTKYREREIIAESLVKTLIELIRSDGVALYHFVKNEEPIELSLVTQRKANGNTAHPADVEEILPADTSAAILTCLRERNAVDITCSEQPSNFQTIYPVMGRNHAPIGCLIVWHAGMTNEQKYLVMGLMRIYENHLSLLEEGQSDKLTGLLNRHTFDNQIVNVITTPIAKSVNIQLYNGTKRRVPDESFSYWLAILDIDYFKRINDTYGHVFGDEILILLSRLLKSNFRTDDLLFRYGGEEFVVLLRAPGKDEALVALNRFRNAVASYDFPRIGRVTISIGFARILNDQVPSVLLAKADQALYYAKENGRNRVCSYEQLIAKGELIEQKEDSGEIELF